MEGIEGRPVFLAPDVSDKGEIRHVYNTTTLSHLRAMSPFSRRPLNDGDFLYVPEALWMRVSEAPRRPAS